MYQFVTGFFVLRHFFTSEENQRNDQDSLSSLSDSGLSDTDNAYFTVEAVLVMPIVLAVIMLLLYLLFFQYNRCLMEQDIGSLALKGCTCQKEGEELLSYLQDVLGETNMNKYFLWEHGDIDIALEGNKVRVSGSGGIEFPFYHMQWNDVGSSWNATIIYENTNVNPVRFIRVYQSIIRGE